MSEPSERAQIGRTPIPGDSPGGENYASETEYEQMQAEATKDAGIHGPVDWEKVVQLGSKILRDKSKDFKVACYVTVGLTHLEQYKGLCDGLDLLVGMTETFWENGFPPPKRMRGRANAFSWMAERTAKVIERLEVQPDDGQVIEAAYQGITDLAKLLEERLGDFEIQTGDLLRALREAREHVKVIAPPPPPPAAEAPPAGEAAAPAEAQPAQAAPPAEGAPVPAPAPAQGAAPATAPAPTPAAAPGTSEIASKADANQLIQKAATYFKEKEPTSAVSYRLTRIVRWADITADPPSDGQGQTQLLDPTPERVSGLRGLFDAGNWETLFSAAEEGFRERPLWLDAQRYSIEAARGLGGAHEKLSGALVDELRSLLRRAPSLPKLVFRDGTAFADPDTRAWIESEVLVDDSGGGAGGGAPAGAHIDPAELEKARQEARQLARKKRLGEGIAILQDVMKADPSPRGRFVGRLEVALLCAETGQDRMAVPVLEELDTEVTRHGLEHWEPDLAVQVLRALYRCRRRLAEREGAPAEAVIQADEAFARLCQVDPQAAAALD
jgi:type VI secretion system protein VasJ